MTVEVPASDPKIVPVASASERPSDARYFSVLDESALLAHSHQGAHVVEEIHKQEGKQDFQKPEMDGAAKIKLQKSRRRVGHGDDGRGPARDAAQHAEQRSADDTDQDCAVDLSRHQDQRQDETEAGGLHFAVGKTSQADKRSGIGDHEFRVSQPDECDEETDSGRGGMLQAIRHAIDDLFADPRDREHEKHNAREENYAQRSAPRNVHAQANVISEVGVERHSGSERNGIVGVKAHHQGADRGGEAGGKNHALDRHPRLGQNLRVDDDDVGHRQESCEAAEKFLLHGGLVFGELEIAIEQSSSLD